MERSLHLDLETSTLEANRMRITSREMEVKRLGNPEKEKSSLEEWFLNYFNMINVFSHEQTLYRMERVI